MFPCSQQIWTSENDLTIYFNCKKKLIGLDKPNQSSILAITFLNFLNSLPVK